MADLEDKIEANLESDQALVESTSIAGRSVNKAPLRDQVAAIRDLRKDRQRQSGIKRAKARFTD